jgi:hypothetical protein
LPDIVLTLKQIEDLFQDMTTRMLGFDSEDAENSDKVRISFQPVGAPAWKRETNVAFIKVNFATDPITQQRDIRYINASVDNASREASYTRVISVQWTFYGPDSFDNADVVRNALYNPLYSGELKNSNLFLILDVPTPVRMPEPFNGQFWERTDLAVNFNESVTRKAVVPYIKSAGVKLYNEKGEV